MSPGRDPPFFAGSILGLRSWAVQAHLPSSAIRLGAAIADATWEPHGSWTEASCKPLGGSRRSHHAPRAGCSCGLYALHPDPAVAAALWDEHIGSGAGVDLSDPCFVEMVGVCGVIEACGRIEVHRGGFRAERARPLALVTARDWPGHSRAAVEELAALYGAEVLEIGKSSEIVDRCLAQGGVLDEARLDDLLGELEAVEAKPLTSPPAAPTPAGSPPPAPPPAPPGRWDQITDRVGTVLIVALGVCWYGFWAAAGISIAGAILFGWFEEEVRPPPAKVREVKVDRERCVISATVQARRKLRRLNVVVDGNLRNGDRLGAANFKLGPIERGRNDLVVARPDPRLCRSRHHFTVRVRINWRDRNAKPVEATSMFRGDVRNPRVGTTESR